MLGIGDEIVPTARRLWRAFPRPEASIVSGQCRVCGDPTVLEFASLCGMCGVAARRFNDVQAAQVPNDWPVKVDERWADWDWNGLSSLRPDSRHTPHLPWNDRSDEGSDLEFLT